MPLRLIEGQYSPGDPFCVDLATDDVDAAANFYGHVFGWEFKGDGGLRALKNERMAAGIGLMDPLNSDYPRWRVCLASADAAAGAKKAQSLGGEVIASSDIESLGPVAIVRDPTGAAFALWQPKNVNPGALHGAHGGIAWAEVFTPDPRRAADFYAQMFGAEAVPIDRDGMRGAYNLQRTDIGVKRVMSGIVPLEERSDGKSSGPLETSETVHPPAERPRWRAYFMVEDTEVFADDAEAAGAHVVQSKVAATGQAVTVLRDPQGAEFAVVEGTAAKQT